MKVLQINAVAQYGSTGRLCQEIKEYINHIPDSSCSMVFADGTPGEGDLQIGSRWERRLHAFLSRLTGLQAYWSHCGTKKLLAHMASEKPDVVLLHNLHSSFIHLPALLTFLAKQDIATLVVLHDCWFYTGKCCHYTRSGCQRWKTGCGNCPRLKGDNKSWFADRTARMWADKKRLFAAIPQLEVVGVSDWIVREARESFLSCAQHITRIYNWIDLAVFKAKESRSGIEQKLQLSGKKIVLGVASGWGENKGLSNFIRLADELGSEYAVILVGEKPALSRQPENLYLPGPTSSVSELADFYSAADVFVTLSLEESFGKVSAEALACGTPVVCFDSTANKEIVGKGCGQVVSPGDLASIQSAVIRICAQGKSSYAKVCRQYAEANFAKEERIGDYLRICERMVNEKNEA